MNTRFFSRPVLLAALSLFWLALVILGIGQFWRYNSTPGQAARAPSRWPESTSPNLDRGHATLVMIVHPKCPCSHASLLELGQLMARSQGRLRATVVFMQYSGVSLRWVQTGLWRQASAIPGVSVITDPNGALTRRFDAQTSGQTYLYSPQGRLLFSGGLTAERGQEGESRGLRAALALLHGQNPAQTRTPVFGCPLFSQRQPKESRQPCRF